MTLTKTHKIILSIVAVAVLLGIYVAFDRKSKQIQETPFTMNATSTPNATTTGVGSKIHVSSGGQGYTIEQVPVTGSTNTASIPNLNRLITLTQGATVSPEAKALAAQKVPELQTMLKANLANFDAWLDLAMYQKMGGDFQGAALSWNYAAKIFPTSSVPLGNLGNLYAYFLHDIDKSVSYYNLAISKAPNQPYLYGQLAEIYRDIWKDPVKARAIIDQGLAANPNDSYLLQFKQSLN